MIEEGDLFENLDICRWWRGSMECGDRVVLKVEARVSLNSLLRH